MAWWRKKTDAIYRYPYCGDLRCGFARVRCDNCGREYLLAFSWKRRHFCPSCHRKRVVEYGEWLLTEVLKKVPRRHWVFGIPKRLRIYFMYDRALLGKPSACAWNVTSAFLKSAVPNDGAVPGASIAIRNRGDFPDFNPHLHAVSGVFLAQPPLKPSNRLMRPNQGLGILLAKRLGDIVQPARLEFFQLVFAFLQCG